MTWKIKALIGVTVALAAGVVAQVAVYNSQPTTITMPASWAFHPQSLQEARNRAQSIVLAGVVAVQRGDDIVTQQPGEPDGVDRIPTRRITLQVLNSYKGSAKAGEQLSLFQTGGTVLPPAPARGQQAKTHTQQLVLEGDPTYKVGEQYLLMLEPGPQGMLRTISPEGRFRHDKNTGTLTAMVSGNVAREMAGKRLTTLEPTLRASK